MQLPQNARVTLEITPISPLPSTYRQRFATSPRRVEGIGSTGALHPLQEGFWEKHGLQCGFCTPGMIMNARSLLQKNPNPSEDEIRHGISGNLCRCTGYNKIVEAIQYAAAKINDQAAAKKGA